MKNPQNLTRPYDRKVRFTKEENDYISKKVEASPFNNFQNFALHMLIQGKIEYVDYSELQHLTSEVKRLGNNVNQIARLAHQFQEISYQDVMNLTQAIQQLTNLVLYELPKKKI